MCTRFYIEPESVDLSELMEMARRTKLAEKFIWSGNKLLTSGEIRPTNVVPVIAFGKEGKGQVFPMKWGFTIQRGTSFAPASSLIVNARSETAAEKPTFKEAWKEHRCIVPASWYYEWQHFTSAEGKVKTGDKFAIQPAGESAAWLCGLYRMEEGFPVFAILTREPGRGVREIHDRMPLMLPKERIRDWINPKSDPNELLAYALTETVMEKVEAGGAR